MTNFVFDLGTAYSKIGTTTTSPMLIPSLVGFPKLQSSLTSGLKHSKLIESASFGLECIKKGA